MQCPKCSGDNPQDARFCCSCGSALQAEAASQSISVKVSRMALVSFTGALCGVALILLIVLPKSILSRWDWAGVGVLTGLVTLGATAILGLVSISRIDRSGGKITGRALAVGAVLISIFSVILALVAPVFTPVRSTAYRMVCGTNLSGLGKAMLIYCGDCDEKLPVAGGAESTWAPRIDDWKAASRSAAYGVEADGTGGRASVSSSLYLLVKYDEVRPKMFVCPQDAGTKEFVPRKYNVDDSELVNLWDFGPDPAKHCSYSYHLPYGAYPLSTSSQPGMAVAADRNPWIASPFAEARDFSLFVPDIAPFNAAADRARLGNARAHAGDGQNVLFLDSHVSFEKRSFCGVDDDNIYTYWDGEDIRRGASPVLGSQPQSRVDSMLVHDPPPTKAK